MLDDIMRYGLVHHRCTIKINGKKNRKLVFPSGPFIHILPSSHFVPKSITPLYKTSQSLQGSFLVMNTENMFVINSIFSLWLRKIKKMCDVTFLASLFPHSHKSSNMNGPFFLTSNTIHKYPVYYKLILISFTIWKKLLEKDDSITSSMSPLSVSVLFPLSAN